MRPRVCQLKYYVTNIIVSVKNPIVTFGSIKRTFKAKNYIEITQNILNWNIPNFLGLNEGWVSEL